MVNALNEKELQPPSFRRRRREGRPAKRSRGESTRAPGIDGNVRSDRLTRSSLRSTTLSSASGKEGQGMLQTTIFFNPPLSAIRPGNILKTISLLTNKPI